MATQPLAKERDLFVFDMDGTLARSKTPMDKEMDGLLCALLEDRQGAGVGGGWLPVFQWQILDELSASPEALSRLHLMPTSSAKYLRFEEGAWKEVYALELSQEERAHILQAFAAAFKQVGYMHPEKLYGDVIEDRGTQITFSALGQEAPIELKDAWKDSPLDRRREIVQAMQPMLPEFEIKIPGKTSIDITRKGVDKGYGVEQLHERLGIPIDRMIFVGDALYEGGNDEPVKRTGICAIAIKDVEETKALIRGWLQVI